MVQAHQKMQGTDMLYELVKSSSSLCQLETDAYKVSNLYSLDEEFGYSPGLGWNWETAGAMELLRQMKRPNEDSSEHNMSLAESDGHPITTQPQMARRSSPFKAYNITARAQVAPLPFGKHRTIHHHRRPLTRMRVNNPMTVSP